MSTKRNERTEEIHSWIKNLPDDLKMHFCLNWGIPHSVFNVASRIYEGDKSDLQEVDWYKIHKSYDAGNWSHGGSALIMPESMEYQRSLVNTEEEDEG